MALAVEFTNCATLLDMQQPAVIAAQYLHQILAIEARGFAIHIRYSSLRPSKRDPECYTAVCCRSSA